jgi:anti-sigma B factor antagonist
MWPPLEVAVGRVGPATIVCPVGELDLATVPALRDAIDGLHGAVVLDLRGLEFIDGAGLHLLLELDARARQDGLELTLVPGPAAERLLGLTGTRGRFRIRESW